MNLLSLLFNVLIILPIFKASYLLVQTLDGSLTCLDSSNGNKFWKKILDPVLITEYIESPLIILNPVDGSLFEFSRSSSRHVVHKHEYSLGEYVSHSPSHHGPFISIGSKNDIFSKLNIRNGSLISDRNSSEKCRPFEFNDNSVTIAHSSISLSFFSLNSQRIALNFTQKKFISHVEEDYSEKNVNYVSTNFPSLLKFSDKKVMWNIPFDSIIIGLYSYDNNPNPDESIFADYLRRIDLPTFIPRKEEAIFINSNEYWKKKFDLPNQFIRSLYIGMEKSQIFALEVIVDRDSPLRPYLRAPMNKMIEGPNDNKLDSTDRYLVESNNDPWIRSILGVYEYPPLLSNSKNRKPPGTHTNSFFGIEFQPPRLLLEADCNHVESSITLKLNRSFVFLLIMTSLLSFLIVKWSLIDRKSAPKSMENNSIFISASFDNPDENGWAGNMDKNVDEPGKIRFNINERLGHGPNGTIVFNGRYGAQDVAIKRTARNADLDKLWIREYSHLMQVNHRNLVKYFLTGSTQSFHYLVLEKCDFSLEQLFDPQHRGPPNKCLKEMIPENCDNIWIKLSMDKYVVCHQLITALAYLHSKKIVHRNLKPSNVLFLLEKSSPSINHYETNVNGRTSNMFNLLLADFGLTPSSTCHIDYVKEFISTALPASPNQHLSHGSLGWMAPEIFTDPNVPQTDSVDIYSCGLLVYFIVTEGKHAHDALLPDKAKVNDDYLQLNRQLFIVHNECKGIHMLYENNSHEMVLAADILSEMLEQDTLKRTPLRVLKKSPLFWEPNRLIRFICDLSDFIDLKKYVTDNVAMNLIKEEFERDLERKSCLVFTNDWKRHLETDVLTDLESRRNYDGQKISHLLRLIRNKKNHAWEMTESEKSFLGKNSSNMLAYWLGKFPALPSVLYSLARRHLSDINEFAEYLPHNDVIKKVVHSEEKISNWSRVNLPHIPFVSVDENKRKRKRKKHVAHVKS